MKVLVNLSASMMNFLICRYRCMENRTGDVIRVLMGYAVYNYFSQHFVTVFLRRLFCPVVVSGLELFSRILYPCGREYAIIRHNPRVVDLCPLSFGNNIVLVVATFARCRAVGVLADLYQTKRQTTRVDPTDCRSSNHEPIEER
uniref:Uncharacterized protein n=1 Tax=Anopheles maculatus TaxID=74869 RepID=A0A182T493_9DIPT